MWFCEVLHQIHEKLQFREKMVSMVCEFNVPISNYFLGFSKTWRYFITNIFYRNKIHFEKNQVIIGYQEDQYLRNQGGYVIDPLETKMYEMLAVFDFSSLYPSIMRSYNISIETLIGYK